MIVKAYGKVNLTLRVLNKLENNYHRLNSIVLPLELHDTIEIKKLKNTTNSYVTYDSFELTNEKYNTVTKAIEIMKEKYNLENNYRVTIYKRLFIAGGLGGGSSDAAAVILAIKKLEKLEISDQELIEIARSIGSDVPFFLKNKMAILEDTGEKVTGIDIYSKCYCLLIKPKEGIKTVDVFNKFDELKIKDKVLDNEKIIDLYNNFEFEELNEAVFNALTLPAEELCPEILRLKNKIIQEDNPKFIAMSGSGTTLFMLSDNKIELLNIMKKYYQKFQTEITKIK